MRGWILSKKMRALPAPRECVNSCWVAFFGHAWPSRRSKGLQLSRAKATSLAFVDDKPKCVDSQVYYYSGNVARPPRGWRAAFAESRTEYPSARAAFYFACSSKAKKEEKKKRKSNAKRQCIISIVSDKLFIFCSSMVGLSDRAEY